MHDPILACQSLTKSYLDGERTITVLNALNFSIQQGEQVAIVGTSGCGKSTLLHCLGGLDAPTQGRVSLGGQELYALAENQRAALRNHTLGFVYQFHHLLPELSALENASVPLLIRGVTNKLAQQQARPLLECLGLGQRLRHKPHQLSGGECQRVAIARALVTQPACILADEPTGNLDPQTARGVTELFSELNRELKTSVVMVTHDAKLAAQMDTTYHLADGILSV